MSDPLITIKNLTKRYRIYQRPIERLRDAVGLSADYKEFDALNDVSFDIRAGEFWGILGKNGSGKSTLLKIVAGLLQPTTGYVETHGKLALLQLGLGFDPEQTGLENIKQSRLLQNLTSDYGDVAEFIAEFSELGDFINYPVKTYSSGMHSRLAFATAIAGAPDILIADEVLAVGDMNFAQKCLSKMRQFKEEGKTIVLVTHDINAVKSFCDHGVWLNEGKLVTIGTAKAVAEDFRNFMLYGVRPPTEAETQGKMQEATTPPPPGDAGDRWITPNSNRRSVSTGKVAIDRYRFASEADARSLTILTPGEIIFLEFDFRVLAPTTIHSFGFTIHDRHGMIAIHVNSLFFSGDTLEVSEGDVRTARFRFEVPMLASGDYSISFGCSEGIDGDLLEKYDHDSVIAIQHAPSSVTNEQGGYTIIPSGEFQYAT